MMFVHRCYIYNYPGRDNLPPDKIPWDALCTLMSQSIYLQLISQGETTCLRTRSPGTHSARSCPKVYIYNLFPRARQPASRQDPLGRTLHAHVPKYLFTTYFPGRDNLPPDKIPWDALCTLMSQSIYLQHTTQGETTCLPTRSPGTHSARSCSKVYIYNYPWRDNLPPDKIPWDALCTLMSQSIYLQLTTQGETTCLPTRSPGTHSARSCPKVYIYNYPWRDNLPPGKIPWDALCTLMSQSIYLQLPRARQPASRQDPLGCTLHAHVPKYIFTTTQGETTCLPTRSPGTHSARSCPKVYIYNLFPRARQPASRQDPLGCTLHAHVPKYLFTTTQGETTCLPTRSPGMHSARSCPKVFIYNYPGRDNLPPDKIPWDALCTLMSQSIYLQLPRARQPASRQDPLGRTLHAHVPKYLFTTYFPGRDNLPPDKIPWDALCTLMSQSIYLQLISQGETTCLRTRSPGTHSARSCPKVFIYNLFPRARQPASGQDPLGRTLHAHVPKYLFTTYFPGRDNLPPDKIPWDALCTLMSQSIYLQLISQGETTCLPTRSPGTHSARSCPKVFIYNLFPRAREPASGQDPLGRTLHAHVPKYLFTTYFPGRDNLPPDKIPWDALCTLMSQSIYLQLISQGETTCLRTRSPGTHSARSCPKVFIYNLFPRARQPASRQDPLGRTLHAHVPKYLFTTYFPGRDNLPPDKIPWDALCTLMSQSIYLQLISQGETTCLRTRSPGTHSARSCPKVFIYNLFPRARQPASRQDPLGRTLHAHVPKYLFTTYFPGRDNLPPDKIPWDALCTLMSQSIYLQLISQGETTCLPTRSPGTHSARSCPKVFIYNLFPRARQPASGQDPLGRTLHAHVPKYLFTTYFPGRDNLPPDKIPWDALCTLMSQSIYLQLISQGETTCLRTRSPGTHSARSCPKVFIYNLFPRARQPASGQDPLGRTLHAHVPKYLFTTYFPGRDNLPPDKIPWDALCTLMSQSIYGGRIDNNFDQLLMNDFVK